MRELFENYAWGVVYIKTIQPRDLKLYSHVFHLTFEEYVKGITKAQKETILIILARNKAVNIFCRLVHLK